MRRTAATAVVVAGADAAAIAWLHRAPLRLAHEILDPHGWLAQVGADRALATVAGAVLWLVAVRLGIGLIAATAAQLPGLAGRAAARISRLLLPAALHRLVAGSAGLGVLLAPAAALAQPASGSPGPAVSIASTVPAPTWPLDDQLSRHWRPGHTASLPAPLWPAGPAPDAASPDHVGPAPDHVVPAPAGGIPSHRQTAPQPGRSVAHGGQAAPHPVQDDRQHTAPPPPVDESAKVAPGDSLWLIAARRLPSGASTAEIAKAWPDWYAANRTVIGDDPGLIHPGQVLQVPTQDTDGASA